MDNRVKVLLAEADKKTNCGDVEGALALCREAVSLVPEPFAEQLESTEVLTAIGDLYFTKGEMEKANKAFADVMLCPGAPASEYIRLRRGQIAFELGDMKKAKTELACAFMNGGPEIFNDEDPKYLAFIEPIMKMT